MMSTDLGASRKLRQDARQRLAKKLCEMLPDLLEDAEFYEIAGDYWSAYRIVEINSAKVILSVKVDEKKLGKPRKGAG